MALKGSCACQAVKFSIPEAPKTFHACHCTTCKAWSGGVLLSMEVGTNPTIDDPGKNVTEWESSEWARRGFCKKCGSSLYYKLVVPGPLNGSYYFCPGGLEDWKDMKLAREMYIDAKPSGFCFQTGPDHVALTRAQVEAQFAEN